MYCNPYLLSHFYIMVVNVTIEKGKNGTYDAVMDYSDKLSFGLLGQGRTIEEAKEDFYVACEDMRTVFQADGLEFPENLEFKFTYDTTSFLAYYNQYLTLSGLSKLSGINKAQLSHYIQGVRNPSPKTAAKIEEALHRFAAELQSTSLC